MVKAKNPDDLIFNKCIETNNNIYFTFKNNDNIVSINRNNYIIGCSCKNGCNAGINNKQLCYHKKHVIKKFGLKVEDFVNKKSILNIKNKND